MLFIKGIRIWTKLFKDQNPQVTTGKKTRKRNKELENEVENLEKMFKQISKNAFREWNQRNYLHWKIVNSNRKDYYKILNVNETTSFDEIKKPYKKEALIHHPDKHPNASQDERQKRENKFK